KNRDRQGAEEPSHGPRSRTALPDKQRLSAILADRRTDLQPTCEFLLDYEESRDREGAGRQRKAGRLALRDWPVGRSGGNAQRDGSQITCVNRLVAQTDRRGHGVGEDKGRAGLLESEIADVRRDVRERLSRGVLLVGKCPPKSQIGRAHRAGESRQVAIGEDR